MKTFAERVIAFNSSVDFTGALPAGVRIMNPFKENKNSLVISSAFYKKYYNDNNNRRLILGINPGRFGAGLTGVPFTDPKRLAEKCGLEFPGPLAHEPSSVFMYNMIDAYGGPEAFYGRFYINSICPLGFTMKNDLGKEVNYNFYDSKALINAVHDFMVENIHQQIALGVSTDVCFCLGSGKNEKILLQLNAAHGFFKKIVALEHPRYVMQYKSKSMQEYIDKYISAFNFLL